MTRSTLLLASLLSAILSTGASAAPVIDGNYDAAYGAAKSTVTFNPALSSGDFSAPTQYSDTTAYSIYLLDQGGYYYGFLKATTNTGLSFANLYFDLDPQNGNGSDFGIEVTNSRAFIPGGNGAYAAVPGLQFVISADGTGIEFVVPNSTFTTALPGLTYYPTPLATNGGNVTLRLSQSFGYTVNGGASYGADRLGSVVLDPAAVPEPETLAILGLGLGALALVRRRKSKA